MEHSEWRKCVDWMVKIGFLNCGHELTKNSATLGDLALFLRDGVALCHLLNKLSPGCLDRKTFSLLPASQFSCVNNIKTFLDCSSKILHIPHSHRFDANKFVRMEIIWEVLKYLSLISKNSQDSTGVASFSLKVPSYYNFSCNAKEPKHSYGYLKMEDFLYYNALRGEAEPNGKTDKSNHLSHCVDELLDTEKKYISVLDLLDNKFLKPLKSVLDKENFGLIFSEIKELLKIHKSFYEELVQSMDNDCNMDPADIFIKFKQRFLIYGHYCKKLQSVLELLNSLKVKDEKFKAHLEECESGPKHKEFKLHEYLIVPMQRVLKYPLILKEMRKCSSVSKIKPLDKAIEETQDLAEYVNEVTRDHDILVQIDLLQIKVRGLPQLELKTFGRMLKDGEIKVKSFGSSIFRQRHLFLFDMKLILCKSKRGNFNFIEIFNTAGLFVRDVNSAEKTSKFSLSKNHFQCQLLRADGKLCLTIKSKLEHEATAWADAIKTAKITSCPVHSLEPRSFRLTSFAKVQICDVCKKLLKGLFCQGYYCQEYDIAAHKECLGLAQHINKMAPEHFPKPKKGLAQSCSNLNYINNDIESQPWYVGMMDREVAFKLLSLFPEKTFLVRMSATGLEDYCINLKASGKVQNIKIHRDDENKFFLSDIKKFHTVVELVSFYETHSLQMVFKHVTTHLASPIKNVHPLENSTFCESLLSAKTGDSSWLDFEAGDSVLLVDKNSENFWLGFHGGRVGKLSPSSVKIRQK